jgi:hypothetical protein
MAAMSVSARSDLEVRDQKLLAAVPDLIMTQNSIM